MWLNGTIGRLTGRGKKVRAAAAAISAPNAWRFLHDPDLTTSLEVLRHVARLRFGGIRPVARALEQLVVEVETPRDEDIDIIRVTALTASQGRYIGNLWRLLPTITDPVPQVAALSLDEQYDLVHRDVMRDSGCMSNGRFRLIEEGWSGRLIAANAGTARRFAWLRQHRYIRPTILPARIETRVLDDSAFRILTQEFQVEIMPSEAGRDLLKNVGDLGVGELELVNELWSPACPDDMNRDLWSVVAYPRAGRYYEDIRLGLADAATPVFDFTRWLTMIAAGRRTP